MTELTSPGEDGGQLRLGLSLLLAVIIGGFFLALAARMVPLESVEAYLREIDWRQMAPAIAAFVVVYSVCHAARVMRWWFLVRPLGDVDAPEVFRVGTVGFTAILLLPLRLGELVRPFLLAKRNDDVSGPAALATIVVERVIDGLIITGLLFVGLVTYQGDASTELVQTIGVVALAIFAPALVLCVIAAYSGAVARRVVMATVGRFSERVGQWAAGMLEQFAAGLGTLSRRRQVVPFLGVTAVYWGTNAVSMWLLLTFGFDLNLTLWEVYTVMAVLVVGIMVPAGPALVGNFEYFVVQGLGLFVVLDQAGVAGQVGAFAAVLHLLQIVVIVVPGVWVMIRHRALRLDRETVEASRAMEMDRPK